MPRGKPTLCLQYTTSHVGERQSMAKKLLWSDDTNAQFYGEHTNHYEGWKTNPVDASAMVAAAPCRGDGLLWFQQDPDHTAKARIDGL